MTPLTVYVTGGWEEKGPKRKTVKVKINAWKHVESQPFAACCVGPKLIMEKF
jgi:hypothetical protein